LAVPGEVQTDNAVPLTHVTSDFIPGVEAGANAVNKRDRRAVPLDPAMNGRLS
jgi:hypothetical protein